uniref:NACHT domain-containing protein n=1 Tax=Pygocentrus nattereri TaxID=42514 RepID=A0AAR2LVP0_PYGNA
MAEYQKVETSEIGLLQKHSESERTKERSTSPVSSSVSVTTNRSGAEPPNLQEGSVPQERETQKRSDAPLSSCVSLKNNRSLPEPPNLTEGSISQERDTQKRSDSPVSSCVSLKNNQSLPEPPNLTEGSISQERYQSGSKSRGKLQKKIDDLFNIFDALERKIIWLVKHELEMYKKILRRQNTTYYRKVKQSKWGLRHEVLNMTVSFLMDMEHEDLADALQNELIELIQRPLKKGMRNKYFHVYEGIAKQGESTSLNTIYTDLYITEGGAGQVNKEHEVRLIEKSNVTRHTNQMEQEVQITCMDMFKPQSEEDKLIRTVLTQGVAGIGKSICVQKFILDWAEGIKYQDIQFIFPLPFRELNLKKKERHSLMNIIYLFFPETKGLRLSDQNNVLFIFDGLDECQLPLAFQKNEILNNVSTSAPLDAVMTNLIKGNLLPSALIWITTRPAATSMIPAECIDRVTEVRGFNDEQKEEYFRKRIGDQDLTNKIIDHIKDSRSLHIMCHIPVFCWISATVLQRILEETDSEETPKTLTQMYTCFLIYQTIQGNVKYTGKNALDIPWDKEGIHSLGKLAFQHLEENSLIFYREDLKACGIDPSKISVYSGLCTQERVRFQDTIYSFVHLSIQEFLAAVFAYISLRNNQKNVLDHQSESQESKKTEVIDFLKTAVDKALESDHGHLDLFLRFLLGLSLESNEKLIRGLLTQKGSRSDCQKDIVEYIKSKFKENPSPERLINLFYCLNELNDDSLVKEIQSHMNSGRLSEAELSSAHWSALVFVLLTSKEKLEVFDLKKFIRSDECLIRLQSVLKEATSALLSECNLTKRSCSALSKVLSSESSKLTLLDLSGNPIQDRGVELLSAGLESANCKLETLGLSFCSITEEGYAALASTLKSNPSSHLMELDLTGNDPGDTGVQKLINLPDDPNSKLKKLRLLKSSTAEEACDSLTNVLGINPLLLRELDLSGKLQGDSEMKKISDLLEDSHCRPNKLLLNKCSITEEGCAALSSALYSNPSHLIELDLSENQLGTSGVKKICEMLKNPQSLLQKLQLSFCSITEEGYAALASALKSNPSSHLMELDLSGNDPGDTGVQKLINLQDGPNCKLKKLRLLKSSTAEEACDSLTKVLGINPLLLRELDLSGKLQGDTEMKKISDLLEDSHCRPNKLRLNKCSITEEGCAALSSALYSNPSHLIELDLSENQLGTSGVKKICEMLKNPQSVLQHLQLSFCSITEEGYAALASALKSKPSSHLMELDLSGNDPGDTGVKKLINLLDDPNSKLKKLRLLKSSTAEEACDSLTKVLGINPLLLRELDLSGKLQGDSEMKKISDLLEDSHCRPNKLLLNKCTITKKGCPALSSALCSNLSHLIELDLSENLLGNSGVKKICEMLKNPQSVLQKLQLSFCSITEEGYAALASALKSNPSSHLMELDLTGNDPGDTGVQKIIKLLDDPNSKLKKLRLLKSSTAEEVCDSLTKVLGINPLLLRELDLSGKLQGDSEMKKISDLLEDSHCRPNKLLLNKNSITMKGCAALSSALCSNPSHLIELDLSDNLLGTSGVKKICEMLKNPQSVLQKLQLSFCSITEEGYAALGSALKSNRSSHLIELDIRGNNPGDTGVKKLVDLQDDPNSNLKKLRLLNSSMAEEVCDSLTKVLGINPLLLRELDLSGKLQGDSEMKKISDLLEDSHCRPNKLLLNKNSITKKGCAALSSALCSNPSHLIELDLSENQLGTSGVKKICSLLNNHYCKLQNLGLSFCSITQEGYAALASSLKSNPSSQLIELDLRGNNPGDRGVKMLTDLLEDSNCQLKKTRLLNSSAAEEVCDSLTKVLGINPLLLSDLDLSGKIQGDSEMRKVSDLLEDSHCRTQKLKLNKSSITEEGCAALSSALCSNPSHLIELDLSQNELGDSGVKKICSLLNNQGCKLMKVGLSFCSITEEGYAALASALTSNRSSHLKELDLRGNDPGHTGVKKLINLLEDTNSNLKKLRFLKAPAAEEICDSLTKVVGTNPLLLRELDLSGKTQGVSELQQLCSLLEDAHCKIEKLGLSNCSIIPESCAVLASILSLDSSSVRKMDLSNNNLQDSGMQHLTGGLTNANCKLEIMMLKTCALTKESCSALADVLNSKYSHLNELDMSNNNLEDSGVVQLSAGLKDPHSSLKIIRLSNSSITEDGCGALASALKSNPSHLMDLDLSENIVENSGVKQLCDLLMNSNCMLQKLNLSFCRITEDGYVALASTLKSNPSSHLIELDLRGNDPGDTGVKKLTDLLEDPNCKLKTLRLLKSFAAEEACGFLTKALGINPLLLRDLDLSGKTQGDSGMKKLCDLLEDSHCKTRKLKLNKSSITEEGCAALSSALCSNPSHLIELDLSENQLGTSGVKKICGVLGNTLFKLSKLELGNCSITDEGCAALASAFRTNPLHLRELNLSGNNVGNFGVKHLSELLMHSQSSLEKLHLSFCTVTEEGYAALASSLKSKPSSHLIQLDLRGNNPGDTGVKKLMDLLDNPNCKLKTLRLLKSSIEEEVCDSLTKVLGISPLLLTELDLSGKIQGNSEMKKLSDLLEDSHCRPKTLKINKSSITEEGCAALSSALCSNPSHLIELDLSENQLGDSGVKKICSLLKKSNCKLSKLNLSFCNVTEGGYTALSSALKSNSSSHLVELDLRGNNPGDRGVKMLTDLVDDPNYKLKTLRLLNSSTAEEFCDSLTKALGKNPLLLRELDLSGKIQGDSGMKKLSDLLEDSHCRITKLLLTRGSITAEGCAALASALCSNPSHLIELDLSENQLGDSGVKKICSLLNTLHCKLKKLNLSFCSLTEKGYVALASALKSSPSSLLTELDLRGNNPGDTGVKILTDIFGDSRKTLRLLKSSDAEEACTFLNKSLGQNPLLQRELDLSRTELKDIKVKQLCALLEDPHYRLEKLT